MEIPDSELVAQTLNGNIQAFGQLVRKYQGAVYGLAYLYVRNFHDAQDLAQEAFLKAYENLTQLRNYERFASWLRQITVNLCNMWLRSKKEVLSIEEVAHFIPAREMQPDEACEREELHDAVMTAIQSLPEHSRVVLTLYYMDGLSYQDIGNFLSVPVSTVKRTAI